MSETPEAMKIRIFAEVDADRRVRFEQLRIVGKDAQIAALYSAIDVILKEKSDITEGCRQYQGCWDENNRLRAENDTLRVMVMELTILDRLHHEDSNLSVEDHQNSLHALAIKAKEFIQKEPKV